MEKVEIFQNISNVLEKKFVKTEKISRILSLAIAGQKFVILYGPGGHGKSQMIETLQENASLFGYTKEDFFYQFFGEGMDEAKLYGNINFAKMNDSLRPAIEYNPEDSFLNKKIAIFEELFDAPASVLLSLKDTLTAKVLRNGSQYFKMKTEVIICLTNREPEEVSELGPSAHALTERFPLQLNVKWDSYEAEDYLGMFKKVSQFMSGPILNGFSQTLAEMVAKATSEGNFISPRTAMHAYEVCQAAALLRGGSKVELQDLEDLAYVDGLTDYGDQLKKDLEHAFHAAESAKFIEKMSKEYTDLEQELESTSSPIKVLQVVKKINNLSDKLSEEKIVDEYADARKKLRSLANEKKQEALQKSLELTRV